MTDPTTILRLAIWEADDTDSVWNSRIPQACQTCKGTAYVVNFEEHGVRSCPDCPTIGTLLLYGWNVAVAVPHLVRSRFDDATDLLAVLREVPT